MNQRSTTHSTRREVDVSVIIPTFNRRAVLPRAIDSVLAQTVVPREIWIVDDGSTDGSIELVDNDFPSVTAVRLGRNGGVSRARNEGARRAAGKWLAFLDSDDAWLPEKLERQLSALTMSPGLICHSDEVWIRRGIRVNAMNKHKKHGGFIFKQCLPLCVMSPSSVLIDRRLFADSGGFDESLPACEDYDLWLRLCWSQPVVYVDEPLLTKYGGHDDQLSRGFWGMDRFRVKALEKVLREPLELEDRLAALDMIINKLNILTCGADKRGKTADAAGYRSRLAFFQSALHDASKAAELTNVASHRGNPR